MFNYCLLLPLGGMIFSVTVGLIIAEKVKTARRCIAPLIGRYTWIFIGVGLSVFLFVYSLSGVLMAKNKPRLATRLCPLRADAWYDLALLTIRTTKVPNDALGFLDTALIFDDKNPFYWQRRALILISRKDKNDIPLIDAAFANAHENAPVHAPFLIGEGFYRLSIGELDRALACFGKASELEPIAPVPWYGMARVYERANEIPVYRSLLKKAKLLKDNEIHLREAPDNSAELLDSAYGQALFQL
jgi:tetratricopeptide (TPR) repeat protein